MSAILEVADLHVSIPLAAGVLYAWGVLLSPAVGAGLMAVSTVVVAANARLLRLKKSPGIEGGERASDEPKQSESRNQKTESTTINKGT